jgi:hypothetical protein
MGVPTLEVGYTSATTGRGDHEVHKGHVVALGEKCVPKCERPSDCTAFCTAKFKGTTEIMMTSAQYDYETTV